ncbi:MAG: hypothetical protein V2A73_08535 [Pseudomonadota bacterium]
MIARPMPRFFNVAGPCDARDHYMLPPERRIPGVRQLIDDKLLLVLFDRRTETPSATERASLEEMVHQGRQLAVLRA